VQLGDEDRFSYSQSGRDRANVFVDSTIVNLLVDSGNKRLGELKNAVHNLRSQQKFVQVYLGDVILQDILADLSETKYKAKYQQSYSSYYQETRTLRDHSLNTLPDSVRNLRREADKVIADKIKWIGSVQEDLKNTLTDLAGAPKNRFVDRATIEKLHIAEEKGQIDRATIDESNRKIAQAEKSLADFGIVYANIDGGKRWISSRYSNDQLTAMQELYLSKMLSFLVPDYTPYTDEPNSTNKAVFDSVNKVFKLLSLNEREIKEFKDLWRTRALYEDVRAKEDKFQALSLKSELEYKARYKAWWQSLSPEQQQGYECKQAGFGSWKWIYLDIPEPPKR